MASNGGILPTDPDEFRALMERTDIAPAPDELTTLARLGLERRQVLNYELEQIPDDLLNFLEDDIGTELQREERAETSRQTYYQDFLRFKTYCEEFGLPFLPASPTAVAYFLLHDLSEVLSRGSVYRICAGLAYVHSIAMHPNPCATPLVRAATRYLRRIRQGLDKAETILTADAGGREQPAKEEEGKLNGQRHY